jgi:cell division protein ZapA (FtsZ GTPase activity inhibitor)
MATITIKLNNKIFPVECDDKEADLVQKSVEKLTQRFEQLKSLSPSASTEYLLLLSAISIQSETMGANSNNSDKKEIEDLENSLKEISDIVESIATKLKK